MSESEALKTSVQDFSKELNDFGERLERFKILLRVAPAALRATVERYPFGEYERVAESAMKYADAMTDQIMERSKELHEFGRKNEYACDLCKDKKVNCYCSDEPE